MYISDSLQMLLNLLYIIGALTCYISSWIEKILSLPKWKGCAVGIVFFFTISVIKI